MIEELKENQIFVFGSNADGLHHGGAAKTAQDKFGAIYGLGHGLMGQSYAIDTMNGIGKIKLQIEQFVRVAKLMPQYEFLLTSIGQGIAAFTREQIDSVMPDLPSNVTKVGW